MVYNEVVSMIGGYKFIVGYGSNFFLGGDAGV